MLWCLNKKKENINSGYLVILDSKAKSKGEEAQLDSFNFLDEKIVENFESNLEASKVPIAEFSFDKNGTLIKINLPKNIDLYNAEKIIDLIRNVIPKLTRNKTEDEDNGIEIRTRSKNNIKKTFSKYEAPKEYVDRYSKSTFKGSKISKLVETDIEDDKITEIRNNASLLLETQKKGDGDKINGFGINALNVNADSKILSTKRENDKSDEIKSFEKIIYGVFFADSKELLNSLHENKNLEKKQEEEQLRKLASNYHEWVLFEDIDFLGTEASAYYIIDFSSTKVVNKIKLKFGCFSTTLGNEKGLEKSKTNSNNDKRGDLLLGTFPILAYEIHLDIKLSMSLSAGVTCSTNKIKITLGGSVELRAEVAFGTFINFTSGVKGKLIGASFICAFYTPSLKLSKDDSKINISSGTITGYLNGKIKGTGINLVNQEIKIWDGWLDEDIPL